MKNTLRYITEKTAVLICTDVNRRYLTGFESSLGYLLMTAKGNILFVDGRYFEAASKGAVNCEVRLLDKIFAQINDEIKNRAITKVLIETENTYSAYMSFKKNLCATVMASASLSEKLLTLRSIKKKEEIESIVAAQRIAEKAFEDVLGFIKEGVTEKQIAALLEYRMREYGSQRAAFQTIAVSGKNTSLPHGVPTDKKVQKGDFVTMDFGAVANGYCSDMTRTVAVGFATDEMTNIYQTVLSAQQNVIKHLTAGIICSDADALARGVIKNAGYGEHFCHSTGHSLGLEIHEKPSLSEKNSAIRLRAGQIVTVEPGIYLPDKFGVRIEDMVLVRKNGCKNLTNAPKHLIIL